jgi:DNA-binding HxlR family transcriptional regulator
MPLVLLCLDGGPRRFLELRVPLARVAPKVLAETLRAMERDGLVTRSAFEENPPRVEYELTALGRSLLGPLEVVGRWSRENLPQVAAARRAQDAGRGEGTDAASSRK